MWLKSYLDLTTNRPTWAYVADVLISEHVSKASGAVAKQAQINTFLQTWKPSLHSTSNLPKDIIQMLQIGKELNVNLEALKLSDSLKEKLPAWYHLGTNKQLTSLNNHKQSKCLRENHAVKTVGDLMQNIKRGKDNSPQHIHRDRVNCACNYCKYDRSIYKCQAPNKCFKMAELLLQQLQPKWAPDNKPPIDNLTHTASRRQANSKAREENGRVVFNPSITTDDDLSHNFRIFTDPNSKCCDPAYRKQPTTYLQHEDTTVHTSGFCLKHGNCDAKNGGGVWFGPNHHNNAALRIPGLNQSNQVGKLAAVLYAIQKTPPFAPLHILTSKYVIDGLTKHLTKWEKHGWIGIDNKEFFKPIAALLRERGAITTFKQSTRDSIGDKAANAYAKEGAQKEEHDLIDLTVKHKFNLTGAQLSCITQAFAYQGIKERLTVGPRTSTMINLDVTRHAVKHITGHLPTDATIWHSIRNKDISRSIRVFLWKMLHGAHKCGGYWLKIPEYEHRSICPHCKVEESMTHILTECDIPGQKEVWSLAKALWLKKHNYWPEITNSGNITGCGLIRFTSDDGRNKHGANRLYRILVSESAHLIWRLRCNRVIETNNIKEEWPSKKEIQNKWMKIMNKRLALDQAMTNTRYEKKAIKDEVVPHTWSGTLHDEGHLPDNWIRNAGVLVGMVLHEWQ